MDKEIADTLEELERKLRELERILGGLARAQSRSLSSSVSTPGHDAAAGETGLAADPPVQGHAVA